MEISDARTLKDLESENNGLKRLLAEQLLVIEGEGVRRKKWVPRLVGARRWES